MLAVDPDIKVVGLVRNPNAVMASWIRAPKEFKPEWSFESEWQKASLKNQGRQEEFYGFEKWKEVASLFLDLADQYPTRFRLANYKNLLKDPKTVAKDLFEFAGIPWGEQTDSFLVASTSTDHVDAYSVFKSKTKDDEWKSVIPDEITKQIESELTGTKLEQYLEY
jgi:hypothetical protein